VSNVIRTVLMMWQQTFRHPACNYRRFGHTCCTHFIFPPWRI